MQRIFLKIFVLPQCEKYIGSRTRHVFVDALVAVSQPRRPCAGANHPPLTHRSPYSPSTQVALLTCLDAPIKSIAGRWLCCVHSVNFRRWYAGAQFRAPGVPKREPSETKHTETRTRAHAHIESHSETRHRGACQRGSSLLLVGAPPPRRSKIRKPVPQKWNHIYSCYTKQLVASHGFAELCFACSIWITSEKNWADHCQGHLDQPEEIPTQCNPFKYGGHLASPGYCPWCPGDASLSATIQTQQFPDRLKWQSHIDDYVAKLDERKTPMCPHPRTQCTEAFSSMQDLKFDLQDVHCIELRKGCKRPSPENKADPRSRKVRISTDVKAHHSFPERRPSHSPVCLTESVNNLSVVLHEYTI